MFLELSQYGQYKTCLPFSTPPYKALPGRFSNSNYNLTMFYECNFLIPRIHTRKENLINRMWA